MRNLKKVLALTVALVMALGLMTYGLATNESPSPSADPSTSPSPTTSTDPVVTTGGASLKYTDAKDIKYAKAVDLLTEMTIMQGKASGQFDPKGDLTRAEMAKMMYVMNNNSIDDNANLYKNAACTLTDANVPDWAEGYIKYCFNKTIVAGMGDNTFKGEEQVTGLQAMKMLLVALGYNPVKEGFVGNGWGTNVGICGQNADLQDGIENVDLTKPIDREVAAQMIYNTMFATEVHYVNGVLEKRLGVDNHTPLTFARDKMSLYVVEGVLVANDIVALTGRAICEDGKSIVNIENSDTSDNAAKYLDVSVRVDTPIDLIGHSVYVYAKLKAGENETKIGIRDIFDKVFGQVVEVPDRNIVTYYTSDDYETKYFNTNATGTEFYINYFDKNQNDVNKAKLNVNSFDAYYHGAAGIAPYDRTEGDDTIGQEIIMVSNNGDKTVEYVFGMDRKFGEITTYSSDRMTLTKNSESNYKTSFFSVEFEDIVNESEFALGDKALMWKIYQSGDFYIDKPGTLKGTLSGSSSTSTGARATISGKSYGVARDHISPEDVIISDFVGKELTYYLDGDMICGVDAKGVTRTSDKYCVVRASTADGTFRNESSPKQFTAYILTSDGSKKTYQIDNIYDASGKKCYLTDKNAKSLDTSVTGFGNSASTIMSGSVYYIHPDNTNLYDSTRAVGNTDSRFNVLYPIDNKVFKYTMTSGGKLTLHEPDIYGAWANAKSSGAASIGYTYQTKPTDFAGWDANEALPYATKVEYGKAKTTHTGSKIIDSATVAFVKSTKTTVDDQSWFVFTGYKDIPEIRDYTAYVQGTADDIMNRSFSAVLGKLSVSNDLVKAYAVSASGYGKTSDTNHYGVILYANGSPIAGTTDWRITSATIFDGSDVKTYSCSTNVRVGDSDFQGWNDNAYRGLIVAYSLAGGMIDEINAVDVFKSITDNTAMVDAGYVDQPQGSVGGIFTMGDYRLNNAGSPVHFKALAPTDSMKVIWIKDMTVTAENALTSYDTKPRVDQATLPVDNFILDASKKFQYSAVAIHDGTNNNLVKGVAMFEKMQKEPLSDTEIADIVGANFLANITPYAAQIHRAGNVAGAATDITAASNGLDRAWTATGLPNVVGGYRVIWTAAADAATPFGKNVSVTYNYAAPGDTTTVTVTEKLGANLVDNDPFKSTIVLTATIVDANNKVITTKDYTALTGATDSIERCTANQLVAWNALADDFIDNEFIQRIEKNDAVNAFVAIPSGFAATPARPVSYAYKAGSIQYTPATDVTQAVIPANTFVALVADAGDNDIVKLRVAAAYTGPGPAPFAADLFAGTINNVTITATCNGQSVERVVSVQLKTITP